MRTQEGCAGHAGLAAEVRAVAVAVLDRLGPALDRMRAADPPADAAPADAAPADAAPVDAGPVDAAPADAAPADAAPADAAPADPPCAVCPVCAVIAAVRRERPELAARLAEQATAMLAVLRTALDEGDPASAGGATADRATPTADDLLTADAAAPPPRRVQHIRVDRPRAAR